MMSLLVPRISDDSLKNFFALTKIPNEEIRELRSCSVCFKRLHLIQCESRKPFHFLGYFLSPLLLSPHLMASENIFRLTGKFHRMVKSKELQMLHNLPSLYLKMFFFFFNWIEKHNFRVGLNLGGHLVQTFLYRMRHRKFNWCFQGHRAVRRLNSTDS